MKIVFLFSAAGKDPPVAIVSEQSSVSCTSTLPANEDGLWKLAAYGEKTAHDLFYVHSLTPLMASNKKESTKSGNDQLSLIEVEELEKAKNVEWHQSSVHTGKYDCIAVKTVGVQTEEAITKVCSCNCSVLLWHHLFMYLPHDPHC